MPEIIKSRSLDRDLKIAVIASTFNENITNNLVQGAVDALEAKGVSDDNIEVIFVPGAFEIPPVLKRLCRKNLDKKKYDGFITIGCVIKGETAHFEYISESVTNAIMKISYEYEFPLGFCVLTCYNDQQAFERSIIPPNAENNKGYEAAMTLIEMIGLNEMV
jgi:6,7-dimethyl-8-ribityllumazine synthase